MAELKTKPTNDSVYEFLATVPDENQRADAITIDKMMQRATSKNGIMWGTSIIGYGDLHYKSPATGREGDWFKIGFSPRKGKTTLYLGFDVSKYSELLEKLGPHSIGKGCLYIKRLSDIDTNVLNEIIVTAAKAEL
jgi:hypothetical protein